MRLLGSNLEQNVAVADAAEASCMGISAFKGTITKGTALLVYRRQCRMGRAVQLLVATDKNTSDIALSVGYRNPSKLPAAFAATFGRSPSGYRAANSSGSRKPTIAAILLQVAYNMSGWRSLAHLCRTASRGSVAALLLTFALTILFDLVTAIGVGMVITVVLSMKMVSEETEVRGWKYYCDES